MIQNILTTIITFGLWNRMTKEQQEKTYKSSWLRVAVYGVLTFLVGVFLYQTYQVAHIRDFLFVHGIRGAYNHQSLVVDTVKFQFNKVFRHPVTQQERDSLEKRFLEKMDTDEFPYCGLLLTLYFNNDSASQIKYFPKEKEPTNPYLAKNGPLYKIDYFSSTVPTIIPVSLVDSTSFMFEYLVNGYSYARHEDLHYTYQNTKIKESIRMKMGKLGCHDEAYAGFFNVDSIPLKTLPTTLTSANTELNLLDIFSAADISKCIYSIFVGSDCPLGLLNINFDIPVEMETFNMPADEVTFAGIYVEDPEKLEAIRNEGSYTFFVKFPTLENLQLIRSLVLTSLVTIFATLFCSNLFYCLRKIYNRIRRKYRMPLSEARHIDKKRVKIYKVIVFLLSLLLLAVLTYLSYRILVEDYFVVAYDYRFYIYTLVAVVILLIGIFIYYLRKKLIVASRE